MRRRELLRHLRRHGCVFVREGSDHSWWGNPVANKRSALPRHTEISRWDGTAQRKRRIQEIVEEMRELVRAANGKGPAVSSPPSGLARPRG